MGTGPFQTFVATGSLRPFLPRQQYRCASCGAFIYLFAGPTASARGRPGLAPPPPECPGPGASARRGGNRLGLPQWGAPRLPCQEAGAEPARASDARSGFGSRRRRAPRGSPRPPPLPPSVVGGLGQNVGDLDTVHPAGFPPGRTRGRLGARGRPLRPEAPDPDRARGLGVPPEPVGLGARRPWVSEPMPRRLEVAPITGVWVPRLDSLLPCAGDPDRSTVETGVGSTGRSQRGGPLGLFPAPPPRPSPPRPRPHPGTARPAPPPRKPRPYAGGRRRGAAGRRPWLRPGPASQGDRRPLGAQRRTRRPALPSDPADRPASSPRELNGPRRGRGAPTARRRPHPPNLDARGA